MAVHPYKPTIWEVQAGGSRVRGKLETSLGFPDYVVRPCFETDEETANGFLRTAHLTSLLRLAKLLFCSLSLK